MIGLIHPKRVLVWLLVISSLILVAHLAGQYFYLREGSVSQRLFELTNRFDMDDEGSVPTWFSQGLALGGAAIAFLIARHKATPRGTKAYWLLAALALGFVSLDEIAQFHELLLQTVHVGAGLDPVATPAQNAWIIVLPLLTLLAIPFLWHFFRQLPRRTALWLLAGILVYVGGSVGLEVIGSGMERYTFLRDGLTVGLEEYFELVGLSLIAFASLDYVWTQLPGLRKNIESL